MSLQDVRGLTQKQVPVRISWMTLEVLCSTALSLSFPICKMELAIPDQLFSGLL